MQCRVETLERQHHNMSTCAGTFLPPDNGIAGGLHGYIQMYAPGEVVRSNCMMGPHHIHQGELQLVLTHFCLLIMALPVV